MILARIRCRSVILAPPPVASRVTGQLNALPGDPLQATPVSSAAAGTASLQARTSYGVLEVNPRLGY